MKNEYQKSLGCSLAITSSSFLVYIWVQRLSQTSFYTWLTFSKKTQVSPRSYFNLTLFAIAHQESLSVHFVCFKICKLSGVLVVVWLQPDQICLVYIQVERLSKNPFTPALRMFSLFLCVTWFFSYMQLFIENILEEAQ